jgi:glycosyltransferase involved in cell wall biosynthesis
MSKRICVVLPTKNEEKTIETVIGDVRKKIIELGHEEAAIIVIDDSMDKTRIKARNMNVVVVNGGGKGLGSAMFKGLKTCLRYDPDIIIAIDADGQTDLNEVEAFIQPIIDDEADLVLGSRFQDEGLVKYHYPLKNRTGIRILVKILRMLTGLQLTDSHGGLRAMTSDVVEELEMIGTYTYVQETIIDAVEKGFRVKELPSVWKKRESGASRVVSSILTYVFYTLPVLILRSGQHIKLLYKAGILLLLLSMLDFIIVGVQTGFNLKEMFDRQSFHLIMLLLSIGLQLFFFGFVLELISDIKRKVDNLEFKRLKQGGK